MEARVKMSSFADMIMRDKFAHRMKNGDTEAWENIAYRTVKHVMRAVEAPKALTDAVREAVVQRKFIPGGRYLANAGRPYHQTQNCLLLRAEDSREGWAELMHKTTMGFMTGAGIGVEYSHVREEGRPVRKTGGTASGPIPLMQMVNEEGRGIVNGGNRRCAIWAGLNWRHPDIHKFITIKNWIPEVKALKAANFSHPATLDMTNISVGLDREFFRAYSDDRHVHHALAHSVYWKTVRQACETGEPGFSVNLGNDDLRNACTEITSADDSDICNLGSINMARVGSVAEFESLVELGTAFLLAGTVYSDVPYAKVDLVRTKNRRLGLGLMGIHEWLLTHGHRYGSCAELQAYLEAFLHSDGYAKAYARKWDLSEPVATRSIAPVGTIGIIGETTTGIEPMFCAAFKQRYWKGTEWHYQYVIDPTAKRLVDAGMDPDDLEDAYSLSNTVERRVEFQAFVQGYVDHGISSTINLPKWGSEQNNEDTVRPFGDMLIRHLPKLRGITCYPDEARGGQPMTAVNYREAEKRVGNVVVETRDVCDIAKAGSCGS